MKLKFIPQNVENFFNNAHEISVVVIISHANEKN